MVIYETKAFSATKHEHNKQATKTRCRADLRNARELQQSKHTNVIIKAPKASEADPRLNRESPNLGGITSAILAPKVPPGNQNGPTK